jgi:hypothetical protein
MRVNDVRVVAIDPADAGYVLVAGNGEGFICRPPTVASPGRSSTIGTRPAAATSSVRATPAAPGRASTSRSPASPACAARSTPGRVAACADPKTAKLLRVVDEQLVKLAKAKATDASCRGAIAAQLAAIGALCDAM